MERQLSGKVDQCVLWWLGLSCENFNLCEWVTSFLVERNSHLYHYFSFVFFFFFFFFFLLVTRIQTFFFFMNGNTERAQCALSRVCIP